MGVWKASTTGHPCSKFPSTHLIGRERRATPLSPTSAPATPELQ